MENRETIKKESQKIKVINSITGIIEEGYVVYAEPDIDILNLTFLYLVSEDETKNMHFEPKLGYNIWTIIADGSPYIITD